MEWKSFICTDYYIADALLKIWKNLSQNSSRLLVTYIVIAVSRQDFNFKCKQNNFSSLLYIVFNSPYTIFCLDLYFNAISASTSTAELVTKFY